MVEVGGKNIRFICSDPRSNTNIYLEKDEHNTLITTLYTLRVFIMVTLDLGCTNQIAFYLLRQQ